MEILVYILIGLAILIALLLIIAAVQPAEFKISRSTSIAASPSTIFNNINDLRKWDAWSPWAKLDPQMKVTYGGPPSGTGATQHWVGNNNVGEGRMTITESHPHELIQILLEFVKPFAATNNTEFAIKSTGNQTEVTWSMWGPNPFMRRTFNLIMNIDKMLGGDFEKGLASLKLVAESGHSS